MWAFIPETAALRTETAEVRRFELPDGTIAWLDGDTTLRLAFTDSLRRVELVNGRASFSVKHDEQRAFEVEADGARARDIGTEFSVNRTDQGVSLAVREGIVLVEGPGGAVTLHAGEATRWSAASPALQAVAANSDRNESWREGKLVFDRATLADALDEIARHRETSLWLMDSGLADRRVNGVVFASRVEEGLDTLAAGANARVLRLPLITIVFGD